ncbi:MAG TPA: beta-phosphoglucomutase family hydrolase [Candidatus Nanopelagicales bacterium]|jgi:beta-phosphoglucomutase family hydrolase
MSDHRTGLPPGIRACLFDMDGVLTDTASVHERAWQQMFDEFLRARDGASFRPFTQDDYNTYVDGEPRADGTRHFLTSRGISLPEGDPDDPAGTETVQGLGIRKNALVQQHIEQSGVATFPSSVDYVRRVRAAGLSVAVVSASENTAQVLVQAGIADLFDVRIDGIVTREQHLAGKPSPDTYLAGAKALGTPAPAAAVFEDAVAGVQAGHAGGFGYVVGVDRVGHAAALRAGGADVVVTDLGELVEPA